MKYLRCYYIQVKDHLSEAEKLNKHYLEAIQRYEIVAAEMPEGHPKVDKCYSEAHQAAEALESCLKHSPKILLF